MEQPRMRVAAVVLGAPDPRALASFYRRLLGWTVVHDEPVTVMLRPPSGGVGLSFEMEPDYVPPVWPSTQGDQQIMSHIDVAVADVEEAVHWAIEAGASLADHQPQDGVRVMLDPAGHPFYLFPGSL
jgi:catechol 2,3-dioxygenase-like lactoylglutathione lyase family enzyme